ncbi:hypothetical protein KI387_042989 [Taxus chinensis]|uniref:Chalcone/stilbene synthase C-terminal domain-containing protein n=1 Tax=Taxus chinensis TaxID=29808 RepID=A0AA38C6G5_TAXCH|nr:hypothetical protein KI387_042989 [Taxus chinensis]
MMTQPRSPPSLSAAPPTPTSTVSSARLSSATVPLPSSSERTPFLMWRSPLSNSSLLLSEGAIDGHLREFGLTFHLLKDVPGLISKNIEKALVEAFQQLNISDWNELFWIAHPGGPAILDQVESKLQLDPKKMRATRHILSEYGNMSSACVLFILDEMRKSSSEKGFATIGRRTGDGRSV